MGDDVSLATRVLCCIMGSIRGGPLAWQSLQLRVLRPLNTGIGLGDKLPGLQVKYVTEFFRTTCSCPRANCVFARPNSTMSCSAPPNTEPAADRHAAACERNMKHPGKNGAVGRAIRRHANLSH